MWIVITIIVVGIIGKFLYDRNQQSSKIQKEGGMAHKYRTIIDILMSGDPNSKIYKILSDTVTLGVSSSGGTTLFILTQTFGKLTVQWKMDSPFFGKHNLEWDFNEYLDQDKMAERIMNDLSKYQNNVITSLGYPEQ